MGLDKQNKIMAWVMGVGLILFVWHNPYQPFIEYMFLPWIGLLLLIMGELVVLLNNWKRVTLGSKWVWIPLAIIAISIGLAGIGVVDVKVQIASVALGIMMFGLYPTARILGKALFKPFAAAVIIESVSIVVYGATHDWLPNGGLLSPTNYDIATGLLIFGVVVSAVKHQWWLGMVAVIGLFFSGSAEAYFCILVLVIAIIARRDWNRKLLIITGVTVLVIGVGSIIGHDTFLQPTFDKFGYLGSYLTGNGHTLQDATNRVISLQPLRMFGNGYVITEFYATIPHNIVLIIVEQAGFLAAGAWLVVSFYLLLKTKWKYAWIMFIALGVWDHFIWTQAAPWFWVLCGVSSLNDIKSDRIFKR